MQNQHDSCFHLNRLRSFEASRLHNPEMRVSAISYLNTAPLMWNFAHGSTRETLRRRFQVDYTIPSRCAQLLAEASADIGIIPVAAYPAIPDLQILPDVAIASRNAVRSILLVSRKSLDQIRTVAIDSSSRSSAALVQVLFAKWWNLDAQFASLEPNLNAMLTTHDAALLIGDPALQVNRSEFQTWDLAEEWRRFTGKPFVFAFWAVRESAASDEELAEAAAVFRDSRDAGVQNLELIADEWAGRLNLPRELIVSYLAENVHYYLDQESIAGMLLFFRYAAELRVLPASPDLRFAPELEIRNSATTNRF